MTHLDGGETSQLDDLYAKVTLLVEQPLLLGDALFDLDRLDGGQRVLYAHTATYVLHLSIKTTTARL